MKLYLTSKYTEFYREPRAILNHNQTFFQWLMLDFFFPLWISIIPTCDQNYISGFLRSVIFGRLSPLYNFSKRVIAIQNRLLAPPTQPHAPNLQYFHYCFRNTHYHLSDNLFASYLTLTWVFALSLSPVSTLANACMCLSYSFSPHPENPGHIHRTLAILSLIIPLTQALHFFFSKRTITHTAS